MLQSTETKQGIHHCQQNCLYSQLLIPGDRKHALKTSGKRFLGYTLVSKNIYIVGPRLTLGL